MPVAAIIGEAPLRHHDHRSDGSLPLNTHDTPTYYQKPLSSTAEVRQAGGSRNRKFLRPSMKGKWQEDPNFVEKFFRLKDSAWKHADFVRDAWYNTDESRWKRIPVKPKKASSLTTPLRNLLNSILEISDIPPSRRLFLKPNTTTMKASRHPLPAPDLLLAGVGPAMTPNSLRFPVAEYSCGLVPVQIRLESEFRHADRHLSAVHANEIFTEQDNRRFVYALVLTEIYLRLYMFDHSGAVVIPRLNYHTRPRNFCAIIEGIASLDEVRAGFDTSISWDHESSVKRISTTERTADGPSCPVSYLVKSSVCRSSNFVGRATSCWLVELNEEPQKLCVIKDAWITTSQAQPVLEGSLIRHANQKGVVRGLVRIRHETCIQVPGRSGDTTVKNRRTRGGTATSDLELVEDRTHTRIVMDTYGKPLEKFSNRRELLLALLDAVQAHRDLLLVAGILHRDISPGNILINPGGEEGDRGVLIDLDRAIYLTRLKPAYGALGTFKYLSVDLLQGALLGRRNKHSYLHDLESFYYVLCCIVCEHNGPGDSENSRMARPPKVLRCWNTRSGTVARDAKRRHIDGDFKLPVKPWIGETILMLVKRLHRFFQRRGEEEFLGKIPSSDPAEDYAEYLSHFHWALDALPPEDDLKLLSCPSPESRDKGTEPSPSKPPKRKANEVVTALDYPKAKRFDHKDEPGTSNIAAGRPRRSKANYRQNTAPMGSPQRGRR